MSNIIVDCKPVRKGISAKSESGEKIDLIPGEMYLWSGRSVEYRGYQSWNKYLYAWVRLIDDVGYCPVAPGDLKVPDFRAKRDYLA